MTVPQTTLDALTVAAAAAADKLGTHIVAFDVAERLGLTDAFLIASGASERQVNAIVDGVEEALLKEEQLKPLRREGRSDGHWVLLDYGNFVVHIQREAEREFYGLDRLYADCPAIEVEGLEPYNRPASFGDEDELRKAQNLEDLPLAGEGPEAADDEY